MTKIYLIRHAEAEGNLYRIAHGQEEGLITDYRGPRQMQALARRFRDIPVDAVYASDLIRTQTTAQAVYVPKGLPLHLEPAFREVHMGVWEGLTWRQIETRWPLQMMEFNHQLDRWQVEGCETAQTVLDRYLPALRRVAREHDGQTVAVFSHGAAMRIVLGTLQGLPLAEIGQSPHGDNTAVSLIEAQGDDLRVVFRDDNSHLTAQEGLSTFGKQTWWKTKGMVEPGQLYRPASHEQGRLFGAPEGGQGTAVWYNGQELIGLYQTVREPDALRITWYAMDPMWRGRRQERMSGVEGKSVGLGGRRIIKKGDVTSVCQSFGPASGATGRSWKRISACRFPTCGSGSWSDHIRKNAPSASGIFAAC